MSTPVSAHGTHGRDLPPRPAMAGEGDLESMIEAVAAMDRSGSKRPDFAATLAMLTTPPGTSPASQTTPEPLPEGQADTGTEIPADVEGELVNLPAEIPNLFARPSMAGRLPGESTVATPGATTSETPAEIPGETTAPGDLEITLPLRGKGVAPASPRPSHDSMAVTTSDDRRNTQSDPPHSSAEEAPREGTVDIESGPLPVTHTVPAQVPPLVVERPVESGQPSTSNGTAPGTEQNVAPLPRPVHEFGNGNGARTGDAAGTGTGSETGTAAGTAAPLEPAPPAVRRQATSVPLSPAGSSAELSNADSKPVDELPGQIERPTADELPRSLRTPIREPLPAGTNGSPREDVPTSESAGGTTGFPLTPEWNRPSVRPAASPSQNVMEISSPGIGAVPVAASSAGQEPDLGGQSSGQQDTPAQDGALPEVASLPSATGTTPVVSENFQTVAEQVHTEPAIQRQVTEQVVASALERARIVQQEGQTRMELQLSPPELGRIRIEISRTERGLKMRVAAESPATAQVLRTNLGEIQSQLAAADMPVESMDIFGGDAGGDSEAADRSFDESSAFSDIPQQHESPGTPERVSGNTSTSPGQVDVKA